MTDQRTPAAIEEAEADKPMRSRYIRVAVSWVVSIALLWLLQSCYGVG
jgi:hypothetical protein